MQPNVKDARKGAVPDEAAQRLHRLTKELIRRYQFRDWNRLSCYGVSISQSHILDILEEAGEMTMQDLSRRMYKSVSTMSRVAGQLVRKRFVRRRQGDRDGREVLLSVTPQGRQLLEAIRRDLVETQRAVLARIPEAEWPGAFKVLEALAASALHWQEVEDPRP